MKHGLTRIQSETIKAWGYFPHRKRGNKPGLLAILSKRQSGVVFTYPMTRREADQIFKLEREKGIAAALDQLKQFEFSWESARSYPILSEEQSNSNSLESGVRALGKKAWL